MKLLILTTLALWLSSCAHKLCCDIDGRSCPEEGHGPCPWGCPPKKGGSK